MSQKVIILIAAAVLIVGGISYVLLGTLSTAPSASIAEAKVFRASLGITPIPEDQTPPLTLYDPLLEAWFEGWDRLYYEFSYPEDKLLISTSDDNRKIIIREKETGEIHTVTITYEGGRGFMPNDYWNEVLKKECLTCRQTGNPIAIKDAQGLITFANEEKEWIIFGNLSGTAWLFVAEISKPSTSIEQVLSTFTFIQPEEQNVKNLVQQLYKAVEEQNGGLAMGYFASPATPAEKERYDWLVATDLPESQRFFRGFLRVKITNPIIEDIKKLDEGKFQVNLTDDFQPWSNADPVGYGPAVKRDMVIIAVKTDDKWLIDEWNYPAYKYKVNKYSGFGQEEIISSSESGLFFLSPKAEEKWVIGETHTIEINQSIKEFSPFSHLTLNKPNGQEVGIISCKIGGSGDTVFNWDTKIVLNYCGAGLEGKTEEIEPGIYIVAITKDMEGRSITASSESFSIVSE